MSTMALALQALLARHERHAGAATERVPFRATQAAREKSARWSLG